MRLLTAVSLVSLSVLLFAPSLTSAARTVLAIPPALPPPLNTTITIESLVPPSSNLTPHFLGLSFEWTNLANLTSSPAFENLLGALTNISAPGFQIRIGGNSEDELTEVPSPLVFARLAELHARLGVKYSIGVRLKGGNTTFAKQEVEAALKYLPTGSISVFEIGNEPNLYNKTIKESTANYTDYVSNVTAVLSAVQALVPPSLHHSFSAPAWGHLVVPPQLLTQLLPPLKNNLSLFTAHYYTGSGLNPATFRTLLEPNVSAQGVQDLRGLVANVSSFRLPVRVNEINSFTRGGIANVSNTLAAALWSASVSFEFAAAGASGVNFHGGGTANYSAIQARFDRASGNVSVTPQANFYGYVFFQHAVENATGLLPLKELVGSPSVKVWAVSTNNSVVRVAVINLNEIAGCNVTVQLPVGVTGQAGTVSRLTGPNPAAKEGVTFAGQTFSPLTGLPSGPFERDFLLSLRPGVFSFEVPLASGALLTIPLLSVQKDRY